MAISSVGLANIPFWYRLPMGISNYGGDVQVYTIPDYVNQRLNIAYNPQALAMINAPDMGMVQLPTTQYPEDFAKRVAEQICQPHLQSMAENNIKAIAQTIQTTKNRLNSMLQKEGLSDEDKEKINALLVRLDEQEEKLNNLRKAENLTDDEIFKQAKEIEKELRKIASDTSQLKLTDDKKANEPQGANDEDPEVNKENSSEANQQAEQSQMANQNQPQGFFVAPEYAGQRAEMDAQMQAYVDQQTGGVRSYAFMAQQFRDAINYTNWLGIPGTDDKKFNGICMQFNKENVMGLLLAYNRFCSPEDKESFMEGFMYDADEEQKPKYGLQIADALKEKAIEVGVYDECREDFATIYDELGDYSIDNTIYKNYDNIIEKIAIAMGQDKFARPYEA